MGRLRNDWRRKKVSHQFRRGARSQNKTEEKPAHERNRAQQIRNIRDIPNSQVWSQDSRNNDVWRFLTMPEPFDLPKKDSLEYRLAHLENQIESLWEQIEAIKMTLQRLEDNDSRFYDMFGGIVAAINKANKV